MGSGVDVDDRSHRDGQYGPMCLPVMAGKEGSEMALFSARHNSGLQITFPNGNTVSVQWGPMTYSSNKWGPLLAAREAASRDEAWTSATAEVAAWRDVRGGETPSHKDRSTIWHTFESGDQVRGYLTPEEVVEFLAFAANNELDVRKREYNYDLDEVIIVGQLTVWQRVRLAWFKFLEWRKRANRPEGEKR